ncbi:hypothetical protein OJF2_66680 [Aquisphaera giovannonii]|uniref:DUF559 domain-containing protein n=1 Tax=Aquisphaera giovannonii TaxID=406548 RepID=A0A5B9WDU2_9BACT|nr:DUF559 domain-containing protein [Aquisphaera giovannonii]QEH38070.1 hypothetical protein OJF2_66680 [Aquisphaera giovannonii]
MPPTASNEAPSRLHSWLDRHEERRRGGIPTVSVVPAAGGWALREVLAWGRAAGRGRALVASTRDDWTEESLARGWLRTLIAATDPEHAAAGWLAGRMGREAGELLRSLRARSRLERGLFLDSALPAADHDPEEAACRGILGGLAGDERPGTRTADEIIEGLGASPLRWASDGRWSGLPAAVATVCGQGRLPLLVLSASAEGDDDRAPPAPPSPDRLAAAAGILAGLVSAHPPLPAALVIDPAAWRDYLGLGEESRARSILRQSVIPAEAVQAGSRTAEEHARRSLAESLADPGNAEKADRARSAAERYLFERLEARPETAGLFRLNETLDFPFNSSRPIEIDLLAPSLKLAVEIDGYYHFTDRDAYRRDRRKDALLQTHGHMVLRVLAEDVVTHLEETLGAIREAVAHRRGRPSTGTERKDDA